MVNNTLLRRVIVALFALIAMILLSYTLAVNPPREHSNRALAMDALTWHHLSTATDDLVPPSGSKEQVLSLVLDIDRDGVNDFVIGSRAKPGPSMVWYRRDEGSWRRFVIETDTLPLEAGGAFFDIDGDGDLDLVAGSNAQTNKIWWWENPYPNYTPNTDWVRRAIKNNGDDKHHDMMFGDYDGDGIAEFVFWNQAGKKLFIVEIPGDPTAEPWPGATAIFTAPTYEVEGLAQTDVDGDGQIDIVGGGYWFKHTGGTNYTAHIIELNPYIRVTAGQLIPGGRPEIVQVPGDANGPGRWFEWNGSKWLGHDLPAGTIRHGHSLELADVNEDGHLDIFVGEIRFPDTHAKSNPAARTLLLLGDSQGNFIVETVATGYGQHESRVADLDGDGDLDILGKPFTWDTPRIDVWLNQLEDDLDLQSTPTATPSACAPGTEWRTHLVDTARPHRSVFIDAADVNGDGHEDIITGAWWYRNPGAPGGTWQRHTIGAPLNQMAVIHDFDGDGFPDILGTKLKSGADENQTQLGNAFVWARNKGNADPGKFVIHDTEVTAVNAADFLQGATVVSFQPGQLEVVLSWHNKNLLQLNALLVPDDPTQPWSIRTLSDVTQSEEVNAGDIDRDGEKDILLGTKWLQNTGDGDSWLAHTLFEPSGLPDRNHLADMNGDGRLDAVVGYETSSSPGKVAVYLAPQNRTQLWSEKVVDTIIAPMSLDVGDIDGDGDPDIVAGEHHKNNPLLGRVFVYLNNGTATAFEKILVATGNEHHDGTQLVDIDTDGDLDIISIGWLDAQTLPNNQVLFYEQVDCEDDATRAATPTPTHTPSASDTPTATTEPIETPTPTATPTETIEPSPEDVFIYISARTGGTFGGITFVDEDILEFNWTTGEWRLFFDGSAVGLSQNDVDAFHLRADGTLLISLEYPIKIAGLGTVDDSDILRFMPASPDSLGANTAGTFELYFDGSDVGLTTDSEDINAIIERDNGHLIVGTNGNVTVPGLKATKFDLLLFDPANNGLGQNTKGNWSLYLKGSAIGLSASSEAIFSAALAAEQHVYLTTLTSYSIGSTTGGKADIFECRLARTGLASSCNPAPATVWKGKQYGLGNTAIDALAVIQTP